jgi:hypothetical protein
MEYHKKANGATIIGCTSGAIATITKIGPDRNCLTVRALRGG